MLLYFVHIMKLLNSNKNQNPLKKEKKKPQTDAHNATERVHTSSLGFTVHVSFICPLQFLQFPHQLLFQA